MAERRQTRKPRAKDPAKTASPTANPAGADALDPIPRRDSKEDASERAVARVFSLALPALGLSAALVAGFTAGLGPALLVAAGTALLGTIGFFWASLRTLSGDAPLPEGVQPHAFWARAPAPERKREALRALKDLELEHSVGKIDDADYYEMQARYRAAAKAVMREMDQGLAPRRAEAERLVKSLLEKKGLTAPEEGDANDANEADEAGSTASERVGCAKCGVSNEYDASFCKKCGAPLSKIAEETQENVDGPV